MPEPSVTPLPEPVATGLLSQKPLAHLLVYALERKLSGTFQLVEASKQGARVVVMRGQVARVWTSEPVVYLGHVLYESGAISDAQLGASLAEIAKTKALHGQVLLAQKAITVEQLTAALRQQRLRKLHQAFTLPATSTFAFYADIDLVGQRPNDASPDDPLASIWRGIAVNPSWDHVRATLSTVNGRPLRATGSIDGIAFREAERAAVESLRAQPSTVTQLAAWPGVDERVAELLAYFLVIAKLAEIAERGAAIPAPPASSPSLTPPTPPPSRPSMGPSMGSGEYVRKVSFSIRAAGPDSHPLHIPSPMPGKVSVAPPRSDAPGAPSSSVRPSAPPASVRGSAAPPPASSRPQAIASHPSSPPASRSFGPPSQSGRSDAPPASVRAPLSTGPASMRGAPASTPAPKKVSPETEQALAQAEMNFVLGERQEALGFVREALTLHPKLPAALILLAALESTNVRDGEDDKLRAILKRMDVILASDPDCRRGRFHRAALRKRLGDLEGAIDDLREVVAADPDDVDALRELKVCERREREAMSTGKSFSQSAMTPKPGSLLDRLLGK